MKHTLRTMGFKEVEVVCPVCGEIYKMAVEVEYLNSPFIWNRAGYPVILCDNCRVSTIDIDNKGR